MDQETKALQENIARLAIQVSRRLRLASGEEKLNMVGALSGLSVAATIAEASPSAARTLYSQARQLAALKGDKNDG